MKQTMQQEEEAGGWKEEKEEEKETEMASARRKRLLQKLKKRKMQRCFTHCSGWSSTGYDMSAVYELKLRKLKMNNRALAKALADQKLETQQWYREVITLKSELQEAQERLLRTTNDGFEAAVEYELEKRQREQCEPINAAISTAMENVVVVVESLTKAKQLAGGVLNSCRKRSSSNARNSSSTNSFPRTSGSRLPLSPSGNNVPPRQSVLPMVSGHVLQPAMVAIPKLDVIWSRKVKERIQAREEEGLDMSAIGEQSSTIEDEDKSTSQREDEAEYATEESATSIEAEESNASSGSILDLNTPTNDTLVKIEGNTPTIQPRVSSRTRTIVTAAEVLESKSSRKTESQKQGKPSKGALTNRVAGESPTSSRANSPLALSVQEDLVRKQEKNVPPATQAVPESEEDPLEGPSWWYPDVSKKRSSSRSGRYARGARQSRQKNGIECPSWQSHGHVVLESSSDSEDDDLSKVSKSIKSPSKVPKEPDQSATPPKTGPANNLDHSYLASPTTMLARLEELEARGGRRSKSRSKGQSIRTSTDTSRRASEIAPVNQRRCTRRSLELVRDLDEVAKVDNTSKFLTRRDETVMDTDSQISSKSNQKDSVLMPPPSLILPDQERDFLITDNDLTCINDVSMEMTEPLSKILLQATVKATKQDGKNKDEEKSKHTQAERRFFKAQSPEHSQDKPVASEKTPFDVSLMDATVVDIPPYSSKRTVEKENLPPQYNDDSNGKEYQGSLSLKRLSIVLKDVMKSPDVPKNFTPTVNASLSSESEKLGRLSSRRCRNSSRQHSIMESPIKRKPNKRRTLRFSVKDVKEDDDDDDDDDDYDDVEEELWRPSGVKKKRDSRRKTASTGKMQMRKSTVVRKRLSAVDTVTEPLKKKQQKKKNENGSEDSVGTPDLNLSNLDDGSENHLKEDTEGNERYGTQGKNMESQSASSSSSVNECCDKVHQTNLQDIMESGNNSEESAMLQIDDSLINVSPILPLSLNNQEDLTKQMENVMKKALQMRIGQSDISGTDNGYELNTDKEQLEKQSTDVEEGVKSDEEKNVKVSQDEKNSKLEQEEKGHLQAEEKESMQEEKDPLLAEKEEAHKKKQNDFLSEMQHTKAQEEPWPENIKQSYQNSDIELEGKQAEIQGEEDMSDDKLQKRNETQEKVLNEVEQQKEQEHRKKEEGQVKVMLKTLDIVHLDTGDKEENIVNNNLKRRSNDIMGRCMEKHNEDCVEEVLASNQVPEIGKKKVEGRLGDVTEIDQPRKRRAASKVSSFKEMALNKKMRQCDGNLVIVPTASVVKRKSGRRSTMECT